MRTLHDSEAFQGRAAPAGVRIIMFVHDVLRSSTKKPRGVFIPVGCVHTFDSLMAMVDSSEESTLPPLPLPVVHLRHV